MNNAFFEFVETYWDEIAEFFKALINWIQAIISKVSTDDESAEDATV